MTKKKLPPVDPGETSTRQFLKPTNLTLYGVAFRYWCSAHSHRSVLALRETCDDRGYGASTRVCLFNVSSSFWTNIGMQYELERAEDEVVPEFLPASCCMNREPGRQAAVSDWESEGFCRRQPAFAADGRRRSSSALSFRGEVTRALRRSVRIRQGESLGNCCIPRKRRDELRAWLRIIGSMSILFRSLKRRPTLDGLFGRILLQHCTQKKNTESKPLAALCARTAASRRLPSARSDSCSSAADNVTAKVRIFNLPLHQTVFILSLRQPCQSQSPASSLGLASPAVMRSRKRPMLHLSEEKNFAEAARRRLVRCRHAGQLAERNAAASAPGDFNHQRSRNQSRIRLIKSSREWRAPVNGVVKRLKTSGRAAKMAVSRSSVNARIRLTAR